MYAWLLIIHSVFRWLVLLSLLYAIVRAYRGYAAGRVFSAADNAVRHWTATIAHLQLLIGFTLYGKSPLVKYFFGNKHAAMGHTDARFFSLIHVLLMLAAIVLITIGSAMAKRQATDAAKFRTQLLWFSIALLLILLAIPWPFSPLAGRPYIRISY